MAGSLTIPNDISAQSGPQIPASYLDENWEAIAAYVNSREVGFGAIASRPAAGVPGRWYYATDQATTYVDNGTAWITVSGTGAVVAGMTAPLQGHVGQHSGVNAGNTNQFNLTFARVYVATGDGATGHLLSTVSTTVDLTVTGAGGRDQGGALPGNSWAHLYVILNPTSGNSAALVSASSWPTATPTLPTGYTEFAYAGAVRLGSDAKFAAMSIRGRRTIWHAPVQVLTNGTAATATSVSCAAAVPPNAVWLTGHATMVNTTAPAGAETVFGEVAMDTGSGPSLLLALAYKLTASQAGASGGSFAGYPASQAIMYRVVDDTGGAADGTNQLNIYVQSFESPNGG